MTYDGDWKNKAAHGYGVMKWQNGDRYEGDWVEGLRQGKGMYTCKASGGKYEGSNGDWYEGQWKSGLRHGQGLYVWKEKNENSEEIEEIGRYEGSWEEGIKAGMGKFTYANGDVFTGPYVGGNRH